MMMMMLMMMMMMMMMNWLLGWWMQSWSSTVSWHASRGRLQLQCSSDQLRALCGQSSSRQLRTSPSWLVRFPASSSSVFLLSYNWLYNVQPTHVHSLDHFLTRFLPDLTSMFVAWLISQSRFMPGLIDFLCCPFLQLLYTSTEVSTLESSSVEDWGQNDRVTALPRPYVLVVDLWPWSMTLTFNLRHDTHTQSSKVSRFKRWSINWKETNERTDGRTEGRAEGRTYGRTDGRCQLLYLPS